MVRSLLHSTLRAGSRCGLMLVLVAATGTGAARGASPPAGAKAESPKADQVKADRPKADVTKADAPKADHAKADLAKADQAKADGTKAASAKPAPTKTEPGVAPSGKTGGGAGTAKAGSPESSPEAADEGAPAPEPKAKARSKSKGSVNHKAEEPPEHVGEGPSPASPPPLTIAGLRDEMRRETGPVTIDPGSPARSKLEQMLEEVTKARTSLHDDTAKLEAMLTQDGGEGAPAAGAPGGAAAAAAGGKPVKNPLDILAKALRGIKPELAAPIVARLDIHLAATVLQRMPPVDAGKIMGAMKPDTAAVLATQIAMRPLASETKR